MGTKLGMECKYSTGKYYTDHDVHVLSIMIDDYLIPVKPFM